MPVILATQEAESSRIMVWSQPRQIVLKTLSWKKPITQKSAGGVAQDVSPEFKPQYHKKKKNPGIWQCVPVCSSMPCVDLCNHTCTQDSELLYHHVFHICIFTQSLPIPHPWQPLSFQKCYKNGITAYVTFWDWASLTQQNALEIHLNYRVHQ
jgi:hypothetical protein